MQDFDFHSCLVNQSVQLIRFVCGLDSRGSDLSSSQPLFLLWDPDQHHRPVDTDQSPHQLSHSCLFLGPQVSPPTLLPSLLPAGPAGPSPSPHQLQPIPRRASPSFCDPGGYRVAEVKGRSPHCYPRHLSEVSASEALRPCWGNTHTTFGQPGETGTPAF